MSLLLRSSSRSWDCSTMPKLSDGGYDDAYRAVPCLWGTEPGSLVRQVLAASSLSGPIKVLDLGCGEGKNAAPFARLGCEVDAVDCASIAIENGKRAFPNLAIRWHHQDAFQFECGEARYDIVICYGLLHCLDSSEAVDRMLSRVQCATRLGGTNVVCTFNDRSHDFLAHRGFAPTLLPHCWYLERYSQWYLDHTSDADLHETHPHNGIPHHHSMTRILARRP
jgi:ubiquinone/menaquinone biosynthesis C-methylase UbiE